MGSNSDTQDQIREIAWMHYVGGLTQAQIATRRGLSKMKVHRFVQAAHEQGLVKIFVNNVPTNCMALEAQLIERFGLSSCTIVPDVNELQTMDVSMPAVASAGARFLHGRLENTDQMILGIGSGRTMSGIVKAMPTIKRKKAEFISVTGDFAALSDANPFEVIHALIDKTEGKGYAFTAPLVVDSAEDRDLFLRQRSIRESFERLRDASMIMIGVGHVGPGSFFRSFGLITDAEQGEMIRQGVVADLAGNLINDSGAFVDTGLAKRMLGMDRDLLRDREIVAVCTGIEKWQAARAALRTGFLDGFISSRSVAERILSPD
nr:sugar-binding domain-containing protein [uncultured Celeribacter sp.]